MLLLSNSRNHAQGLLRDGRGGCAASAVSGFRAPERRFPLLLGLVSYSLSFAVFNLAYADFKMAYADFKMAYADIFLARADFRLSRGRFYLPRRSFGIVT